MGIVKTFEAQDVVPYTIYTEGMCTQWPSALYNDHLVTPPRIYSEEVNTGGALWCSLESHALGDMVIHYMAGGIQRCWPSWFLARWKFDDVTGKFLSRDRPSGMTVYDLSARWTYEPGGSLWKFDNTFTVLSGGAVQIDPVTLQAIGVHAWADYDGGNIISVADFSIDRANNRVFIRSNRQLSNEVAIYRDDTKAKVASIWTTNPTYGIVLTNEGTAYVCDEEGWIFAYDYDGQLLGWMRNNNQTLPFIYGWDPYHKRLLRMLRTPVAVDGASTLRIEGFYPVPELSYLSPPIPRKVPRKNRRITVLSRAIGTGAEPIAGRSARLSGDVTGAAVSDTHGDIIAPITPTVAGPINVTVTV